MQGGSRPPYVVIGGDSSGPATDVWLLKEDRAGGYIWEELDAQGTLLPPRTHHATVWNRSWNRAFVYGAVGALSEARPSAHSMDQAQVTGDPRGEIAHRYALAISRLRMRSLLA